MTLQSGQNMNPADSDPLQKELQAQANALLCHDQQLTTMAEGQQTLAARYENSMESVREHLRRLPVAAPHPSSPAHSSSASEARVPPPERCSGASGSCRPFLVQCSLAFELQPSAFPTERSRVAYIISLLTGRARAWGTAEWERDLPVCASVSSFSTELRNVFDHETPGREAAQGLLNLTQGGRTVTDYAIEFRTIAAESSWNAPSLLDAFYHGLSGRIKDELAARDLPTDLDYLVALAIHIEGSGNGESPVYRLSSTPPFSA